MRRAALTAAAICGGVVVSFAVWAGLASWAYAYLAQVPLHSWFYYAVPWPGGLWDRAYLIVSGAIANVPFVLALRIYLARRAGPAVYGRTKWADRKQMTKGGIKGSTKLS